MNGQRRGFAEFMPGGGLPSLCLEEVQGSLEDLPRFISIQQVEVAA
jgi:hypothetical protein